MIFGVAIHRFIFIFLTSFTASAQTSVQAQPSTLKERREKFNALIAEHWQYTLRRAPEFASILGDRRYNDRWSDMSLAAITEDLAATRQFLARLQALDVTDFAEQDILNHELLQRALQQQVEHARFENWLMPVDQFAGVHINVPSLVPLLAFGAVKDYDDYITRLKKLPELFEQNIELMRLGVQKHLMPPQSLLVQCVSQARRFVRMRPAESPFAKPVENFPETISAADRERIRRDVLLAIAQHVLPAYQRFANFLRENYVPHGRQDPGLWALPEGEARYAARVQQMTTTDLSPEEIHAIGLSEVTRIEAEQASIAKKLGFTDFTAFKRHVRNNPLLYAKNRADILTHYRHYTEQMYEKLPMLFGRLPQQKMTIVAVESFREKEASGAQYDQGTKDGSRPGIVRVNTYEPTKRLTIEMESTAYHEGVPGHHMQIAIQQELPDLPDFRQQSAYVAFQEGWALYSEKLGKEVGFYQNPYNDYGRLQDEMLRAIRLVVDTGVHAKHWTRAQMVQFFHDHSTIDEPNVQAETDRYIAVSGQALGYKIGQLKISGLRAKAQTALGAAFDVRAFHDEVLGAGALPLDILERRIDAWIARSRLHR